ncbi:MAG: 50S ribosomal protein L17 [Verrucomicrobia bacterium TMED60]|jgi:large subunit ribosomal protein L17|nr:MAG: 50S ribosomal protein L17 [Verrucomicrobia bacterium TMED60]|tara:strand:- start:1379 stop:2122 length:744 start_codon:yes stop_codon:yes gene_type:complete
MRHRKHNHQLGVKTAHRSSLIANLSCSLIENGRIKTTLAKARALRPSIEKAITLAKKAHATDDSSKKLHYRRLAIARLRSKTAVAKLFDELVEQFANRSGGYTRIYKLAIPRLGDAAEMALIEFVEEVAKKKTKKKKSSKKSKPKEAVVEVPSEEVPAPEEAVSSEVEDSNGKEDLEEEKTMETAKAEEEKSSDSEGASKPEAKEEENASSEEEAESSEQEEKITAEEAEASSEEDSEEEPPQEEKK